MSHAKESEQVKETRKREVEETGGERPGSRKYQRRDKTRSRDGSSEEKERKGGRRSSEDRISKSERKRSLERDRTRQYKEREERTKKDEKSNQCKSQQSTKVTYVTGRKKSIRSEDTKGLESTRGALLSESGSKTNTDEESQRRDDKKKECNWIVEGKAKVRKRESSSSSSSSNSSDWEAPWERAKDDGRKKKKMMQ